jgi:hypothetical protein
MKPYPYRMSHGADVVSSARTLGKRSAGFFATKEHRELKESLFSVFFVILRGYTNFKTAASRLLTLMPIAANDGTRVRPGGGMVDAWDLKSPGRKAVPVRVRPRAPAFAKATAWQAIHKIITAARTVPPNKAKAATPK